MRLDVTGQDWTSLDETGQDWTRPDVTRRDRTRLDETGRDLTRLDVNLNLKSASSGSHRLNSFEYCLTWLLTMFAELKKFDI